MTKNRLLYFFVLALILSLALFSNEKYLYAALYSVAFLPFASLAFSKVFLSRLEILQSIESDIILKEQPFTFCVRLRNKTFLPSGGIRLFYLEQEALKMASAEKWVLLNPNEQRDIHISATISYRGAYNIGLSKIETKDVLGLFIMKKKITASIKTTVYPLITEPADISFLALLNASENSHARYNEDDYTSIYDVRQYSDSDSLKKIHWKLSAKKAELITKTYPSLVRTRVGVFPDLQRVDSGNYLEAEDKLIESVVAVINHLLTRGGYAVELICGEQSVIANDVTDFQKVYEYIAHIEFANGYDVSECLDGRLAAGGELQNAIVFTKRKDDSLKKSLLDARARGWGIELRD